MNENLRKPMNLAAKDLTVDIAEAINRSALPMFMVEFVVRDIYLEVQNLANQQYELDKSEYESVLQTQYEVFVEPQDEDEQEE